MKTAVWATLALLVGGPLAWGASRPGAPAGRARPALRVSGSVTTPLRPGLAAPLNLKVTNRSHRRVQLTRLLIRARIDARHGRAGCTRRDYAIRPLSRRLFPIRIRPHRTVRLRARVRMKNPSTRNQDACKGARLMLRYRGWAR